jgi:hypothetical protein
MVHFGIQLPTSFEFLFELRNTIHKIVRHR